MFVLLVSALNRPSATTSGFAIATANAVSAATQPSLQAVPQSELSNVSLDNLECILQVLWGPTSSNSSQMVELTPTTDLEYGEACNLFKLFGRKLHKIYRIQNATLFIQYMTEKRKMDQKYANQADSSVCKELFLYHGTDRKNVESINAHGFDRSYSGVHDSGLFGSGVYFARDLSYSAIDYYSPVDITSGHKFVYVARVLVGRFCQGHFNMKHLPNQENGIQFDSAVNNVINPTEFVIFRDTRAYPLYLYEFSWVHQRQWSPPSQLKDAFDFQFFFHNMNCKN